MPKTDPSSRPPLRQRLIVGALRGCLYGAAAGGVFGFIRLTRIQLPETEEVVIWRTAILIGGAIGSVIGLLLGPRWIRE